MNETKNSKTLGRQVEELLLTRYSHRLQFFLRHPALTAFGYMMFAAGINIISTLVLGGFANTPGLTDLTEEPIWPVGIIAVGVGIYYWLTMPNLLRHTFDELQTRLVFAKPEIEFDKQIDQVYTSSWVRLSPEILVASAVGLLTLQYLTIPDDMRNWLTNNSIVFAIWVLSNAIAWRALAIVLANTIFVAFLIYKIFQKNEITVYSSHPDGGGGFGALASFSLRMSYLALILAAFMVVWAIMAIRRGSISSEYLLFLLSAGYFVTVPILFYLPLHVPHKAMVAYRNRLISDTAQRYHQAHQKILQGFPTDAEELELQLKYLDKLQELQAHNRQYPVWPFNLSTALSVLANAITPSVLTIIGLLQDLFG